MQRPFVSATLESPLVYFKCNKLEKKMGIGNDVTLQGHQQPNYSCKQIATLVSYVHSLHGNFE